MAAATKTSPQKRTLGCFTIIPCCTKWSNWMISLDWHEWSPCHGRVWNVFFCELVLWSKPQTSYLKIFTLSFGRVPKRNILKCLCKCSMIIFFLIQQIIYSICGVDFAVALAIVVCWNSMKYLLITETKWTSHKANRAISQLENFSKYRLF